MSNNSTLIVGCGYVGRALATQLHALGTPNLRAWSRRGAWSPSPHEELGEDAPCELEAMDVCAASSPTLKAALAGVKQVVLSYAPGRSLDATPRQTLYLQAPQNIIPHLAPGARVVALSSTSALPDLNLELDESCSLMPQSERGQLQRKAEDTLWTLAAQHQVDLVILRLAGIYGPGRSLLRLYGRPKEDVRPGDGHVATNLVHRDDIVAAIHLALQTPGPIHRLYHLCGNAHPTRREMITWAHQSQGLPPPAWSASPCRGPVRGKRVNATKISSPPEFGGLGLIFKHPCHRPKGIPIPGGNP